MFDFFFFEYVIPFDTFKGNELEDKANMCVYIILFFSFQGSLSISHI